MSVLTCSGGTSPSRPKGASRAGTSPASGRGLGLSILRPSGLLHQEGRGLCDGRPYAHSLACQAIDMAVSRCPIEEGVTIFHPDGGSQYTAQRFLGHLDSNGIRPSVGRTEVC